MFKQLFFLLALLLVQLVSAGPSPDQPIGENPEFGRGRGGNDRDRNDRDRGRWTWCRCRIDDRDRWDGMGGRRDL